MVIILRLNTNIFTFKGWGGGGSLYAMQTIYQANQDVSVYDIYNTIQ